MQKFTTELVTMGREEKCIVVPLDVACAFGGQARVPVEGKLNGCPFRTSLMPQGDGTFFIVVSKAMQIRAHVAMGAPICVELEKAGAPPEAEIPSELQSALAASPKAAKVFAGMTPGCRREYAQWIASAKRAETRSTRAAKAINLILAKKKLAE